MAKSLPVVVALFVTISQMLQNSTPPTWLTLTDDVENSNFLSRILILVSTFLLMLDNKLVDRYRSKIHWTFGLIIDFIMAYIAIALILYVWTQFQSMLCMLLKELLLVDKDPQNLIYEQLGGDIFLGYFTTAMSILTFWYSFKASGSRDRFKNAIFSCCDLIADICLKVCDCSDDEDDVSKYGKK